MSGIEKLEGEISPDFYLTGELDFSIPTLVGEISLPTVKIEIPEYEGEYFITPSASEEKSINCYGKRMMGDITVFKIPYYETSNEENGLTVYIADEV